MNSKFHNNMDNFFLLKKLIKQVDKDMHCSWKDRWTFINTLARLRKAIVLMSLVNAIRKLITLIIHNFKTTLVEPWNLNVLDMIGSTGIK